MLLDAGCLLVVIVHCTLTSNDQPGKVNDAVDAFSESIRILPSADSHCNLANIMYTKLNDTQSAINHLQKALALDPTDGEVYFNLGVVLEREGMFVCIPFFPDFKIVAFRWLDRSD